MSLPTAAQAQLDAFIDATYLIPAIMLDGVIAEVYQHLTDEPLVESLYASLRNDTTLAAIESKTGHAFSATAAFKKAVSVADPRPAYYSVMRVWVSAEIKAHYPSLYHKLPLSFRKGDKV
jgi:hypothetical protein